MAEESSRKLRRLSSRPKRDDSIRILYVEDAAVIRDTIAKLLELNGYNVEYAKNGKEGVDKALSWKPDVVLMDLRMPVMDGYKAISEITFTRICGNGLEQ
jgi:CheY-like chemotaxis protein